MFCYQEPSRWMVQVDHHGLVHYEIPPNDLSWSGIFGLIEAAKQQFSLEGGKTKLVVKQTTMEQVFRY